MGVELDFSGIYNLAGVNSNGEEKTVLEPENRAVSAMEGETVAKLTKEQNDRKRLTELCQHFQSNAMKAQALKTEILEDLKVGAPAEDLFLKAMDCIAKLTEDQPYSELVRKSFHAIYGEGLLHEIPLERELEEVEHRLRRLREAQEDSSISDDARERIRGAIGSHERERERLLDLLDRSKKIA